MSLSQPPSTVAQDRRTALMLFLVGGLLPWLIVGLLAIKIERSGHFVGDRRVLIFLNQHSSPWLDKLAVFLANVGDTVPMMGVSLLIVMWLLFNKHRQQALLFALSVGGSMLLTQVLKPFFARPRPDLWVSIKPAFTFSFPSGHAMDTAAVATALAFVMWRFRAHWLTWLIGPIFVLAVGWCRMYLGVHFPSDVLAGWLSAMGWVVAVHLLAWLLLRPTAQPQV